MIRYVGVVFLVAGVVVGLAPSLGFTMVTADRGVSVATADDGTALIALESTGTTVDGTGGTTVATLRNNAGESLSTTYRVSVNTGDLTVETSDGQTTLSPDGGLAVALACRPGNRQGTAQLQVTVPTADGATVAVSNAILTVDVSYDCQAGGGEQGPPGDDTAYNDADGDGQYDPGETAYTADQLRSFQNESVDLVIDGAGTIDTDYRELRVESNTITVKNSTLASDAQVRLTADGAVTFQNASVGSEYGQIRVSGSEIRAAGSTITTNDGISLDATSGPVDLTDSTVESEYGRIDVDGPSISARNAEITTDDDITLVAESGDLDITGATVDSRYGQITVRGSTVTAVGATVETNADITFRADAGTLDLTRAALATQYGEIVLVSGGDTILTDAAITATGSGQARATLGGGTATLFVDGLTVADTDATLRYGPAGVAVSGTLDAGSVTPN